MSSNWSTGKDAVQTRGLYSFNYCLTVKYLTIISYSVRWNLEIQLCCLVSCSKTRGSQLFFFIDHFWNYTGLGEALAAKFVPYSKNSSKQEKIKSHHSPAGSPMDPGGSTWTTLGIKELAYLINHNSIHLLVGILRLCFSDGWIIY